MRPPDRRASLVVRVAVVTIVATLSLTGVRALFADPSFGLFPGSPSSTGTGDLLESSSGAPSQLPLGSPVVAVSAANLGLPAGVGSDDVSFGNDHPSAGDSLVVFSVDNLSAGYPLATHDVYSEALGDDGAAAADVFLASTLPAYATPWSPGCALTANSLLIDGDGLLGGGNDRPDAPGIGLDESPPGPPGTAGRDDLNALEMSDNRVVDSDGDGVLDKPVFFTVGSADAPLLGFSDPSGADVYMKPARSGAVVRFASAAALGLQTADDIDALAVYRKGANTTLSSTNDRVVFSLKPGSPSLATFPMLCGGSVGNEADLWITTGGSTQAYATAERLGLCAKRTSGLCNPFAASGDDNVDAIDIVQASGVDADGDGIDDAVDPDDQDGDGITSFYDNCPDNYNPLQENSDSGPAPPFGSIGFIDNGPGVAPIDDTVPNGDRWGDACDSDDDNDGLPDDEDVNPLLGTGVCAAFAGSNDSHPNPARGDFNDDDDGDGNPAPSIGNDGDDDGPSWDTDGDGVRDGIECQLGTNPRDRTSTPTPAQCGGTSDADLDGLSAAAEFCKWGTDPDVYDSDGDGLHDCIEANDNNGDNVQNFAGDTVNNANAANGDIGKTLDFDLNGDGFVNFAGDSILSAGMANKTNGICL